MGWSGGGSQSSEARWIPALSAMMRPLRGIRTSGVPSAPLRPGEDRPAAFPPAGMALTERHALRGDFMVRLTMAVAAGVLAGGLAIPSAASADTAQIVYAWGFNDQGQVSVPPVGSHELSPVPIRGAAANVTQLAGSKGSFV